MNNTNANGSTEAFAWKPGYDAILEQIALTDKVDAEWAHLRDMIKHKLANNVRRYLSDHSNTKPEISVEKTSEQLPRSSPMSLPPSSPSTFTPSPATASHQGLIIQPFPRRERRKDTPMRTFNDTMDETAIFYFEKQLFEQLDEFDSNPPFTIQRLCELCVQPKKHYRTVGKYLRALERTILVTSSRDMYPSEAGDVDMIGAYGNNESLRLAMTPVFTPIPFLHDDARRSRSPSPFELSTMKGSGGPPDDIERPSIDLPSHALGLVDELDDPKPGHLADRPTALTAVTSTSPASGAPPLSERFVKSTSPELGDSTRDVSETADSRQAEDAEVEGMVLDDNVIDDEEKENRPS